MAATSRVLIFLRDADRAQRLAKSLTERGLEAICVTSSDDAYQQLNLHAINSFIVDNEQKGFLSGLDIIERLYQDLLRPMTVVLSASPSDIKSRAAKLGVDHVVLTAIEPDKLAELISQRMIASPITQILIPPKARKIVQECSDIPPVPQLIVQLLPYLETLPPSIEEIANIISVDPKVTADVLKVTNSSATGMNRRVSKIFDAVNYLGPRRVISIVVATSAVRAQSRLLQRLSATERLWFNRRCVVIASAAQIFAERFKTVSPDTAYVLGLLQDIGILAMCQSQGRRYQQLIRRVRTVGQLRLDLSELHEFGVTHAEVSGALLQQWGMPSSFVSTIAFHHRSDDSTNSTDTENRFRQLMLVGEAIADLTDGHTPHRLPFLVKQTAELGNVPADELRTLIGDVVARSAKASSMFLIPIPKDNALNQLLDQVSKADLSAVPSDAERVPVNPATRQERIAKVKSSSSKGFDRTQSSPTKRKILVIEDDMGIVDIISRSLASFAVEVSACDNLASASQVIHEASAVLCDMHLGVENGAAITQSLRNGGYQGPIIIVTGDRTRHTVARTILAGATDFLVKPFNKTTLVDKLSRHGVILNGRDITAIEQPTIGGSMRTEPEILTPVGDIDVNLREAFIDRVI